MFVQDLKSQERLLCYICSRTNITFGECFEFFQLKLYS